MDFSRITNLDPQSIYLEAVVLNDIERELKVESLKAIAPGLALSPNLLSELEDDVNRLLMPWLMDVDDVSLNDYDAMYEQAIKHYEEQEQNKGTEDE